MKFNNSEYDKFQPCRSKDPWGETCWCGKHEKSC